MTGCKKDMLFICLIYSLYVRFCQKTKEITVFLYWRYGTVTKHSCIVAKLAYVLIDFYWLEHVWTSCRPDDDPNEGVETCCQTNKSIKRRPIWLQYSCVLWLSHTFNIFEIKNTVDLLPTAGNTRKVKVKYGYEG